MILDAILVVALLYVGHELYLIGKSRYLTRKLEKNIINLYPSIPKFDRSEIASLRASLRNCEGLINQSVIDKARVLLALREGYLDVKEKKDSY